jgi:aspartyl/asparaginyl beta-hydroxylase (cupin superfamily)
MSIWQHPFVKRVRPVLVAAVFLGPGFYFAPIFTLMFIVCGMVDVSRHRRVTYSLIRQYFTGNGIWTWAMSPVNLLADLFSVRNKGVYKLADMPAEQRSEIEACVQAFVENGDRIKAHLAAPLARNKRYMLAFIWYNTLHTPELRIPAFERRYRHIKTIAVSAFSTRTATGWHFGPLRFTFRVLYNLEPVDSRDVFIEVDDRTHYWVDDPLLIFDDTMVHRSINNVDHVRYCLFLDIVRRNYARVLFEFALGTVSLIANPLKRLFYKNWMFVS